MAAAMKRTSSGVAWFSAERAAEHLDFPNVRAFYKWLARQPKDRPRRHYIGRMLRFRQVDLDAAVETPALASDEAPRKLRVVGGRS
jgi:hypothetical protein